MKLLGIDYGEKKVGLAIGDADSKVATPYKIIKNYGWQILFGQLLDICVQEKIEKIIVGVPINPKAQTSGQLRRTNQFVDELSRGVFYPVETQNEQFTTQEAKKLMVDGYGGGDDDAVAAMLILQGYIDKL